MKRSAFEANAIKRWKNANAKYYGSIRHFQKLIPQHDKMSKIFNKNTISWAIDAVKI